ncbi:MAG: cytochrome c [Acuticoccus sp.]
MLKRALVIVVALAVLAGAAAWWLSAPQVLSANGLPAHTPDADNGRRIFFAGGCASCHAAEGAEGEAALVLAGGRSLETPFGPIAVPNISSDPTSGIGNWSSLDFANAMVRGVSPEGGHYVPAFPWTSYRGMRLEDVIDLKAFLDTLPASDNAAPASGLPFPFAWRRPIGLWKRFLLPPLPPVPAGADAQVAEGHYLTIALGHCGECHTPRNSVFAPENDRLMAGAPSPTGEGRVPNISPSPQGIGDWSDGDVAYLLESGFTPDFDSVGGEMSAVVTNWSQLSAADRQAVEAYLRAIPPQP